MTDLDEDEWDEIDRDYDRAGAPDTDAGTLDRLAASDHWWLRARVAERSDLTPELVARLAKDSDHQVRARIAGNAATPGEIVERLTHGRRTHPEILRRVAAAPTTPAKLLRHLAECQRWDVQRLVGGNPSTPTSGLKRLAKSNLWPIRAAVAGNPSAPEAVVARLARDNLAIRFAVAGNPSAPPTLVAGLLGDHPAITANCVANPSCPAELIEQTIADPDQPDWVVRSGAANPSCPADAADAALAWLALGAGSGDPTFDPVTCTGFPAGRDVSPQWWYEEQARLPEADVSPLWPVRRAWMSGKRLNDFPLSQLLADGSTEVRRTAASFEPLPKSFIEQLTDDADAGIAHRAKHVKVRRRAATTTQKSSGHGGVQVSAIVVAVLLANTIPRLFDDAPAPPVDVTPTMPLGIPDLTRVAPTITSPGPGGPIRADSPLPFGSIPLDQSAADGTMAPWFVGTDSFGNSYAFESDGRRYAITTGPGGVAVAPEPAELSRVYLEVGADVRLPLDAPSGVGAGVGCVATGPESTVIELVRFRDELRLRIRRDPATPARELATLPTEAVDPSLPVHLSLVCATLEDGTVRIVGSWGDGVAIDHLYSPDTVIASWRGTVVAESPPGASATVVASDFTLALPYAR